GRSSLFSGKIRRLQSRSIWRRKLLTSFKTDDRFWRRQFPAAATDTSPREVHSKFSRRNEAITRACTGKLSMHAETQSWLTPMRICVCHQRSEERRVGKGW